jgi:hypothetical protein
MNINIECESDNYYDRYLEEVSARTNYGEGYEFEEIENEKGN